MVLTQDRQLKLANNVKEFFIKHRFDYGHDFDHTIRVVYWTQILCNKESGDSNILIPAAFLHDFGVAVVGDDGHAEYAAENCGVFLEEVGYCDNEIQLIGEAIKQHSTDNPYSGERTLSGNILFDADKLDTLGASSLYRWIYEYQRKGYLIHDSLKQIQNHIQLFKNTYGIEIFFTKTAQKLGAPRLLYTERIFEEMASDMKKFEPLFEEVGISDIKNM